MPPNDRNYPAYRCRPPADGGPVAQWLESAAHNGLVAGSSPAMRGNDAFIDRTEGVVYSRRYEADPG